MLFLRKRFSLGYFVLLCAVLHFAYFTKMYFVRPNIFCHKYHNISHSLLGRSGGLQEIFFEPEVLGCAVGIRGG